MAHWLFKSEPETWSFDMQKARGKAGQEWDGVRNFAARNHMRAMKKGDLGFFYHTGGERRIVGIVEVIREAHPESKDPEWDCVDIAARSAVPRPVSLEEVKADQRLADMPLVRLGRLSVQPVSDEQWTIICQMAGVTA